MNTVQIADEQPDGSIVLENGARLSGIEFDKLVELQATHWIVIVNPDLQRARNETGIKRDVVTLNFNDAR